MPRGLTVICLACLSAPLWAAERRLIWRSPGEVRRLDLRAGPAAQPRPPFQFLEEESGGASPKALVRDGTGRRWSVKWGNEVKAEIFATRLAWAVGYFGDPSYFVRSGVIRGAGEVSMKLRPHISRTGHFTNARFELRDRDRQYLPEEAWTWTDNPFAGTRELNGLKILVMLLANWDNKDARERAKNSNLGVYAAPAGPGEDWHYLVTDWGGTMGRTGIKFIRNKWSCEDYARQSWSFVKSVTREGFVQFRYTGWHTFDMKHGIHACDVAWLMTWLDRLSPAQIRDALHAAGATQHESACFQRSLKLRFEQLRTAAAACRS